MSKWGNGRILHHNKLFSKSSTRYSATRRRMMLLTGKMMKIALNCQSHQSSRTKISVKSVSYRLLTSTALLPCGHQRLCASCVFQIEAQGRGCRICRILITTEILYSWYRNSIPYSVCFEETLGCIHIALWPFTAIANYSEIHITCVWQAVIEQ